MVVELGARVVGSLTSSDANGATRVSAAQAIGVDGCSQVEERVSFPDPECASSVVRPLGASKVGNVRRWFYFFGKLGSLLISRICWMWRSAWVEISSIHCQQSITSGPPSPKLCARMSS